MSRKKGSGGQHREKVRHRQEAIFTAHISSSILDIFRRKLLEGDEPGLHRGIICGCIKTSVLFSTSVKFTRGCRQPRFTVIKHFIS
jgi:hypothetical protein